MEINTINTINTQTPNEVKSVQSIHNVTIPKLFVTPNELQMMAFRLGYQIAQRGFIPDIIVAVWRGGAPIGLYVHEFLKVWCEKRGIKTVVECVRVKLDHIAIRTQRYVAIGQAQSEVKVESMEYLLARLDACEGDLSVLVLDDIFDSGRSYAAIRDALYRHGIERRIGRLNRMDEINQEIVVLKSLLEQPVIAGELYATTDEKNDVKNASANNYVYARDLRIGTVYYKPTKNQTPYTPDYYVEETTEWVVFGHELEGLTDSEITEYFGEDVLKMLNA